LLKRPKQICHPWWHRSWQYYDRCAWRHFVETAMLQPGPCTWWWWWWWWQSI